MTGTTLLLGEDTATLTVRLIPDLIDWTAVKLANVELHYTDGQTIDERESFTFRKGAPEAKWELGAARPHQEDLRLDGQVLHAGREQA